MSRRVQSVAVAAVCCITSSFGCVGSIARIKAPTPENMAGDTNYRTVPTPSEDDSILGRIVMSEPRAATSFEAEARPNPCEHHLEPARDSEMVQEVHRAQRLGAGAEANATLNGFGFSTRVEGDTHLVFDLATARKLVRRDTAEYTQCCRGHDCGFGYISTLVYGRGEYASGRETRVAAEADYLGLAGGGTTVNVAASERKQVQGWVMAVVTPHEVLRNMDQTRSRSFVAGGSAAFAAGLGGLGMMAYGLVRGPQLEDRHGRDPDEREALSEQIQVANRLAIAGGITGGLLTATGIGLLVVGVHGRQRKSFALAPQPSGLVITGRF